MGIIELNKKQFTFLQKLGPNKTLVERNHKRFVIISFENMDALKQYLSHKKTLAKMKVEMSKVLKVDKKNLLVLENYIIGESLASILSMDRITDDDYMELFRVYRNNRFAKILLNYKPDNFIKTNKGFYYTSDEVTSSDSGIAFERSDDILLWINTEKQKKYIERLGIPYFERVLITNSGEIKKKIALLCTAFW